MEVQESIYFKFTGGMTDSHELNFYEASRFQYGAARFIYTLEHFRQKGRVLNRLNTKIDADIRIRAAEPSCFLQEVLFVSLPIIGQCAISVPFTQIFTYAWNALLPKSNTEEKVLELANQIIDHEENRLALESEREVEKTKQLEILRDIVAEGASTTQQSLEITKMVLAKDFARNEDQEFDERDLEHLKNTLQAELQRNARMEEIQHEIGEIDPETENRLIKQLRKNVSEIGLPLRSSADYLEIGDPSSPHYVHVDNDNISELVGTEEDDVATDLLGEILSFDKEGGYGKFVWDEIEKPLSFRVPGGKRNKFRNDIIEAMKSDEVLATFFIIRDANGNPVSLTFQSLIDD